MINSILKSISITLNTEFGDKYENYIEEKKQGLKGPCFFISCLNPTNNLFLGKRYFRVNQFCIQYFTESKRKREECNAVAERLYKCLEWITVNGDLVMGLKMNYEIVDDVLQFFVNYDLFVYRASELITMGDLTDKVNLKEGG